jgi:hypothetical protein
MSNKYRLSYITTSFYSSHMKTNQSLAALFPAPFGLEANRTDPLKKWRPAHDWFCLDAAERDMRAMARGFSALMMSGRCKSAQSKLTG